MGVIFHNIAVSAGLDGLGMRRLKVIALQVPVISHFPIRSTNNAITDIGPLIHAFGRNIIHHAAQKCPYIDLTIGR